MKKEKKKSEEYELCKVCKINHNQGRRHNFFPRHTNSLSSLFSRFLHKLSFLKSSLSTPSFNLPHHSSPFWCIFCEFDIYDFDSFFSSGNVSMAEGQPKLIHFESLRPILLRYLPITKSFFYWLDFWLSQYVVFLQWKKKCEVLKCKAAPPSGIQQESLHGVSNDIRPNYGILNTFAKNNFHFLESRLSKNVLPLQYYTNENYQVCHSDISEAVKVGPSYQNLPQGSERVLNSWNSTYIDTGSLHPRSSSADNLLADGPADEGVHTNQSTTNREPSFNGCQTLTRLTSGKSGVYEGNVYSGAPPPWLERSEPATGNGQSKTARTNSAQKNIRTTIKLNPKRVGAAWAEKRRKELEMEKRGEIFANTSAPDWLPNFGSVWQSGSRKESMKEYKEKVSVAKAVGQLEAEVKLQPYISKRMRLGTNACSSGGVQKSGDTT